MFWDIRYTYEKTALTYVIKVTAKKVKEMRKKRKWDSEKVGNLYNFHCHYPPHYGFSEYLREDCVGKDGCQQTYE